MELKTLVDYTRQLLDVERFVDYCPNGLQVEGQSQITKIATGVTASLDFLKKAQSMGAQAALVHHGYFWKNEQPCLTGIKRERIRFLLEHDMSLLAYHLPLDRHPVFGNNVTLAKRLDIEVTNWAGEQGLLGVGHLKTPLSLAAFTEQITQNLDRAPQVIGSPNQTIHRIAWCTGAAQSWMNEAINLGVDAFLTGEISEPSYHLSLESGVAFIAAGHHATERYGVQALGEHLASQFGIEHLYIEIDNPI
jgi:dinuclear metal center YbgI/SA1388 family protein